MTEDRAERRLFIVSSIAIIVLQFVVLFAIAGLDLLSDGSSVYWVPMRVDHVRECVCLRIRKQRSQ